MKTGLHARMDRLFNRHGDGRAICVAADHGYVSDVTPNVINLRSIIEATIAGGVDAILFSPGQALRMAHLFQGRNGPALIVRADWTNMPRLGTSNVANSVPQRLLINEKIITAEQALSLGATAITIFMFFGYSDKLEAIGVDKCAKFVHECRIVGLPCIVEPLAYGGQVTGANIVEILTLGGRMAVEIGADALKVPYTGDVDSFHHLIEVSGVPTLVLGGARSENERDALELYSEAQEAGASGCLMGRNVTKSRDPRALVEQLCRIAHQNRTVDEALRDQVWKYNRLKANPALCTGCSLCLGACVTSHDTGDYGLSQARLRIESGRAPGEHRVMFCTSCKKCIDICPTKALRWQPKSGAVELLIDRCDDCSKCVDICPTRVIIHSETGITFANGLRLDWYPVICDLCGGKPECTRICPTGAIFIAERQNFNLALE